VLAKRFALLLALLTVFGISLPAQESPDADNSAGLKLSGDVRNSEGAPVPGSTLRAIQTSTGKAWVSWTDENGNFEFPTLPAGHYRVEISQLGFAPATQEMDLSSNSQAPLAFKLDVGTLAAINAAAAAENPTKTESANASAPAETAKSTAPGTPSSTAATPSSQNQNTNAANNATTNGTSGGRTGGRSGGQQGGRPGGAGQGGGRRGFQQLGLNSQNQNNATTEAEVDQTLPAETGGGQLGQAASADAVQMMGTVAMGQTDNPPGGFGQPGAGPGGGPDTQFGNTTSIPGQAGAGAPGGVPGGGGFGGGPGGGGFGGRGGGGGGRGGAAQRRGPQRGAQGIDALMGAQRLLRQRINRVHYSIYDTFGDSALNARPYSLTQANPPKIAGWTETAGMNIGGPLKIPHVYDGSDKTFFYINFGGTWTRSPVDSFATVPTAAERLGDFSADAVELYNPASNFTGPRTLMPNAGCTQDLANTPGTCVPQNMISQQSLALLNYIPLPNLPGETLNYHLQTNLPGLSNRLNVNVTHQISSKLSLQVNYNLSDGTSHSLSSYPGIEGDSYTRGQSVMVGLTQNWTKTFLHNSQLYFSRTRTLGLSDFSYLTDVSAQLGLTGVSTSPFDFGLPSVNLTNFTGLSSPTPSLSRSQTYRYVDSAKWMKAKHTLTIGGEIRKMDINRDTDPTPNGQFSFTGLMTSQLTTTGTPVTSPNGCGVANPSVPCIGSDFADFLLGYPANTKVQFGDTSTYFRDWGLVGYATDDWHMFPRFTMTYGVRYEAFTPPTEINDRIVNLAVSSDFTTVQCVTPLANETPTDNCIGGQSRSLFNGHYNNWAPRLGIAWQPPGKWFAGQHQLTIRAGYSMFYVEAYLNTLAAEMANQPPFATANTLTTQTVASSPLSFLTNLSSGSANSVTNTVAVNPNYHVPYAMIWNTSIEYNLLRNTFMEVMYTGTRGVHLDELLGFGPSTTNPNVAGFTYDTSGAFSNFNALQVRLQKRMSRGLGFTVRYTYSKSLDDASTIGGGGQTVIQNNADPRGDYGLSSFTMRNQFLGNFTYQLPFGDRQRFATRGWEKDVFGAWRINATFTANSGTPYTVKVNSKNPDCQNVPGVNSERADQIGNPALADKSVQEYFNTAVFSNPSACYGDAPRNSVIGPGTFTINSGLSKTIQFGRDGLRRLDFTWNTSNLLNHVNYTGLSTVYGSATFGQIMGAGAMRSMTFTTRVNF